MYQYPRNLKEWWANVDEYWPQLSVLIERFHPAHPMSLEEEMNYPISATLAEKIRVQIVEEIRSKERTSPLAQALIFKEQRQSGPLYDILSETYWGMPESMSSRTVAGFHVLCDLCSEYTGEEE